MVVHVEETGDWHAARGVMDGPVILPGTLERPNVPEKNVHEFFRDWADRNGPGRPLSWFRERIAAFNEKNPGEDL